MFNTFLAKATLVLYGFSVLIELIQEACYFPGIIYTRGSFSNFFIFYVNLAIYFCCVILFFVFVIVM